MSANQQRVLVLDTKDVERLLTVDNCIELMALTLADLTRERFHLPLRMIVRPPNAKGLLGLMPAYRSNHPAAYGLKAICVFPENPGFGKDAHQGSVMLFNGETGELMALMNASPITTVRTAAVSAVATRLLSREDASELAIVGSGVQARSHLAALSRVRPIKRTRVVSKNREHADKFVAEMKGHFSCDVVAVDTAREALNGADLIVTVTNSHEPVIDRQWISPGAHINAIGTYSAAAREIDGSTMAAARLYVDRREAALNESGDFVLAIKEGLISADSIIAEIGEVLIGTKRGRESTEEITLFKSLGLAVEDLACAEYLFSKAQEQKAGMWVSF